MPVSPWLYLLPVAKGWYILAFMSILLIKPKSASCCCLFPEDVTKGIKQLHSSKLKRLKIGPMRSRRRFPPLTRSCLILEVKVHWDLPFSASLTEDISPSVSPTSSQTKNSLYTIFQGPLEESHHRFIDLVEWLHPQKNKEMVKVMIIYFTVTLVVIFKLKKALLKREDQGFMLLATLTILQLDSNQGGNHLLCEF